MGDMGERPKKQNYTSPPRCFFYTLQGTAICS